MNASNIYRFQLIIKLRNNANEELMQKDKAIICYTPRRLPQHKIVISSSYKGKLASKMLELQYLFQQGTEKYLVTITIQKVWDFQNRSGWEEQKISKEMKKMSMPKNLMQLF